MMPPQDAIEIPLTHDIYTPAAIEQTIRAFDQLCGIETDAEGGATRLRFHLKTDCPSTVCDDFLNYALELSAQELLSGKG